MESYTLHRNGNITVTPAHQGFEFLKLYSERGAKTKKTFIFNGAQRRKLAGAVCELFDTKKHNLTFVTLTTKENCTLKQLNPIFHKFLNNAKKTYKVNAYVAVAELQQRGAVHYHCLFDAPFFDIVKLNNAWCSAGKGTFSFSKNAVQLSKGWQQNKTHLVYDRQGLVNYLCKYISKCENQYTERNFFCSRHLLKKPVKMLKSEFMKLTSEEGYLFTGCTKSDYCTTYYTDNSVNLYERFKNSVANECENIVKEAKKHTEPDYFQPSLFEISKKNIETAAKFTNFIKNKAEKTGLNMQKCVVKVAIQANFRNFKAFYCKIPKDTPIYQQNGIFNDSYRVVNNLKSTTYKNIDSLKPCPSINYN